MSKFTFWAILRCAYYSPPIFKGLLDMAFSVTLKIPFPTYLVKLKPHWPFSAIPKVFQVTSHCEVDANWCWLKHFQCQNFAFGPSSCAPIILHQSSKVY